MISKQKKKNKGIAITLSLILGGLFAIGLMGLIYWIFISRILEVHVAIDEYTNERHAINLANLLLSSEKIVYEKEGKLMRGILDSEKLDNVFSRENFFSINNPVDIGIGYPNSITIVRIIDLESCSASGDCKGWAAVLSGPISLEGLSIAKFTNCLSENVKLDVGSIFRFVVGGMPMTLWQPWDLKNCVQNTVPSSVKSFFTNSEISSEGFPVLIKYPNGDFHLGRMSVAVGEFL
jgi:hypothetical protein